MKTVINGVNQCLIDLPRGMSRVRWGVSKKWSLGQARVGVFIQA